MKHRFSGGMIQRFTLKNGLNVMISHDVANISLRIDVLTDKKHIFTMMPYMRGRFFRTISALKVLVKSF